MLSWNRFTPVLPLLLLFTQPSFSQNAEMVQVGPPPVRRAEPPGPSASVEELEAGGDQLRAEKDYLDAMDYYVAASQKSTSSASLQNKMGICNLMMQRYKEARKNFSHAVKIDHTHADAYNNLGVVYYVSRDYGKAIKTYQKATALNSTAALSTIRRHWNSIRTFSNEPHARECRHNYPLRRIGHATIMFWPSFTPSGASPTVRCTI